MCQPYIYTVYNINIDINDSYQWLQEFMAQNWVVDQTDMFFFSRDNGIRSGETIRQKCSHGIASKVTRSMPKKWMASDGSCTVILKETNIFVGWGALNVERNWTKQHVWSTCPCIQETVLAKEIKELIIVILSAQPPAKQNTETSFSFFRPNTPNTKHIIYIFTI